MENNALLCSESAKIRDVMELIDHNKHGFIFCTDGNQSLTGLATDGDIRRWIYKGGSLEDDILACANKAFIRASLSDSREHLLMLLDNHIRFIPVLDDQKRLVTIISRDMLPVLTEKETYSRAKSPVRISFGGGGSDLTHYFVEKGGAVVNATLSLYSHATLRKRSDRKVIVHSRDLSISLECSDLEDFLNIDGPLQLVKAALRSIMPNFGFELWLYSDFPVKSGLGGSAAVVSSILGCFNEFRRDKWNKHEIAELAYQAERMYLGIAGGWQDQYATVFGGFNFMEFQKSGNVVQPLRISNDVLCELEGSLVLCDTGIAHDSGQIHEDQKRRLVEADIQKLVQKNVSLSYEMRNKLLRGQLDNFGSLLDQAWQLKRKFSSKITSQAIDDVYDGAIKNGAYGGKLLGAGGGGFFLFYVPAYNKFQLMDYLTDRSHTVQPFQFEVSGLQSWTMREKVKD